MDRLFNVIKRINSILLLLILLAAGLSFARAMWPERTWESRDEIPIATEGSAEPVMLRFESVESIAGAHTQMIDLSARKKADQFSPYGSGGETRNMLFLTGDDKAASWLFPHQRNVILVTLQLSEDSRGAKEKLTRALYVEYVTDDSDHDGKLTSRDLFNVALTRPDGSARADILQGVSRTFTRQMLDGERLSLVYQKGASVRHAVFAVDAMQLEKDQEIASVPAGM